MHCKIIEIVAGLEKPMRKGKWARSEDLPESFTVEIADYTDDLDDEYIERLKDSFVESFGEHCVRNGSWITFDEKAKEVDAERRSKEFIEAAKTLSELSFDDFCGIGKSRQDVEETVWKLTDRFEDKFGLYVYVSDEDKMVPFDAWLRRMKPGERYFMGGVMDYHW